jgi:hypothetical protein
MKMGQGVAEHESLEWEVSSGELISWQVNNSTNQSGKKKCEIRFFGSPLVVKVPPFCRHWNRGSASTSTFSTKVLVLVEKVEILVEMAIATKSEA